MALCRFFGWWRWHGVTFVKSHSSNRECPETSPCHHSFIHSLWQWIWTLDRVHCQVEEKGKNGGGIKGGISCSEPSLWPPDPTPDSNAYTLLSFPQPLDIFFLPKAPTIFFFLIFHKMSGWDERTDPRTFCGCLVYRFYTLHSSPDGLSLDFDLTCLCSALRACGVGVGWQSLTLHLQQQSHHQQGWGFFCVRIYPHLLKVKKVFQIISTAVRERQSKCWQGGKEVHLRLGKIKWLVWADMFCSVFFE